MVLKECVLLRQQFSLSDLEMYVLYIFVCLYPGGSMVQAHFTHLPETHKRSWVRVQEEPLYLVHPVAADMLLTRQY